GVRIWDEFVNDGVKGIMNILVYKKMINGMIDVPIRQFILDYRDGYTAPFSGLLDVLVSLGNAAKEGEVIATLYDPEKDFLKEIKANHPGVVFSVRLKSKINRGETMFSLLHFKRGKDKAYAINAQMVLNKEALHGIVVHPTKVLDTFLSIFDSSYNLLDTAIGNRVNKIKSYFRGK
ncbi:succinylglutamate desuccinylase/aspartoacylase family protein, partial [Candidatus Woesearchaeota archaeon]|nr:succinylglutamate desuccinylase/aspartoacylase family protein [Candidatus Woesearchaeota archaeon]